MQAIAGYGRIARFPGVTLSEAWRMPRVDAGPWGFRPYAVLLWPEGAERRQTADRSQQTARSGVGSGSGAVTCNLSASPPELLLSLKTMNRDGQWKEFLPSPQPLSRYVPPFVPFDTLAACMPQRVADAPGSFYDLVGHAPLNWHRMENGGSVTVELQQLPPGSLALRWTGGLRGLLVLGRVG